MLTRHVFNCLYAHLVQAFEQQFAVRANNLGNFQLFGFGSFNRRLPSLKLFIEQRTGKWVNGKYLYNKLKEYEHGKNLLVLNREFVYVYFKTLGYAGVAEYVEQCGRIPQQQQAEQLQLLGQNASPYVQEYYAGYFYGEQQCITVSALTLFNNYKEAEWHVPDYDYTLNTITGYHTYKGLPVLHADRLTVSFSRRHSHQHNGDAFLALFAGYNVSKRPFITGTYASFDMNSCPVCGEIIFQQVGSKTELEVIVAGRTVPPAIANRLLHRRLHAPALLPQTLHQLDAHSPYAHLLQQFTGNYTGYAITLNGALMPVHLAINPASQVSMVKLHDLWTLTGGFQLKNAATLLHGLFTENDKLPHVQVYISTAPLPTCIFQGIINGIATDNQPFAGQLYLMPDGPDAGQKIRQFLQQQLPAIAAKIQQLTG